jgi:hypothetical protein
MLIKISAGDSQAAELLIRQLPRKSAFWNGIEFAVNKAVERCDWWVVCHSGGLLQEEEVFCDPDHIVFISMEPPDWGCPRSFYNQFNYLISCDRHAHHRNIILKNGLTWWVGLKVKFENGHQISPEFSYDYDSLSSLRPQQKQNRISVITSGAKSFHGHVKRLKFLEKLASNEISRHIDFFGGHCHPIEDKMDALASYRYNLAIENSNVPHYWSEKLADPLLGWCMPVYHGCPNIERYFPQRSMVRININDFNATVRALWDLLESDLYSRSLAYIKYARELVLNDYNIFQLIAETCSGKANRYEICSLRPMSYFAHLDNRFDRKLIRKTRLLAANLVRDLYS